MSKWIKAILISLVVADLLAVGYLAVYYPTEVKCVASLLIAPQHFKEWCGLPLNED